MCRMFAVRAERPIRVEDDLLSAPTGLARQSCGDRCGTRHEQGWGIGWFAGDGARLVRSARPAGADPLYAESSRKVCGTTVLAHVRKASMGSVAEANCHPFGYGRWLFAHNGTLQGFPAVRTRLRGAVPPDLVGRIEGETDSEHAFYFLLGRLRRAAGGLEAPADPGVVVGVLTDVIRYLHDLCPGTAVGPSEFNFILTDGRMLAASRWGHTLYRLDRARPGEPRAAAIASEPTSAEPWVELPDRCIVRIDPDLSQSTIPIG